MGAVQVLHGCRGVLRSAVRVAGYAPHLVRLTLTLTLTRTLTPTLTRTWSECKSPNPNPNPNANPNPNPKPNPDPNPNPHLVRVHIAEGLHALPRVHVPDLDAVVARAGDHLVRVGFRVRVRGGVRGGVQV